jgi:two-component sensor kinase yesM
MRIRRFFSESLHHRLILYFMLLMMIPISVAGTLIYRASDVRISDSALALAEEVVGKTGENLEAVLLDMQSAAKQVAEDHTVQILMAKLQDSEKAEDSVILELDARLKQIAGMYAGLDGVYICLDDFTVAKSRYYAVRDEHKALPMTMEQYEVIRNHEDIQWIVSDEGSLVADNMGNAVLSAARLLPLSSTGQPCGIVVVEVRQSYLKQIFDKKLGESGTIFLMSARSNIALLPAAASDEIVSDAVNQIRRTDRKAATISLHDRVIFYVPLSLSEWTAIGVVMKQSLRGDSQEILTLFVITVLMTLLLTIFVSGSLADYELRPIRRIQTYIKDMENGEFGKPLPSMRSDEIGSLAENTQEMSEKIGELLETVKTEQKRMRTAEFKALQAQINPHFLYNSLDSINWLVRKGNTEKATEMISALTTFFRIGLSKGRDIITVREELEHVRSYLVIQKIRYENQFEYSFYVDPETENYFVPKLMLQPLVENALYHGIKLCDRKCILMIQVLSHGDRIEIEVLDNGAGMDAETLESVRKAMEHKGENRANSYGVVNVNDRIQILAGQEYGLRLTSEKGVGTSARIVLPKTLKGA